MTDTTPVALITEECLRHVFRLVYQQSLGDLHEKHHCSLKYPCKIASEALIPIYALRMVCISWDKIYGGFSNKDAPFFYPDQRKVDRGRDVDSHVRRGILLKRYRIYKTIQADDGEYLL